MNSVLADLRRIQEAEQLGRVPNPSQQFVGGDGETEVEQEELWVRGKDTATSLRQNAPHVAGAGATAGISESAPTCSVNFGRALPITKTRTKIGLDIGERQRHGFFDGLGTASEVRRTFPIYPIAIPDDGLSFPPFAHLARFQLRRHLAGDHFTNTTDHIRTSTKMASIDIGATSWRRVEVGRVLKLESGSLATIVEIIDHKRVRGNRPLPRPRRHSGCV